MVPGFRSCVGHVSELFVIDFHVEAEVLSRVEHLFALVVRALIYAPHHDLNDLLDPRKFSPAYCLGVSHRASVGTRAQGENAHVFEGHRAAVFLFVVPGFAVLADLGDGGHGGVVDVHAAVDARQLFPFVLKRVSRQVGGRRGGGPADVYHAGVGAFIGLRLPRLEEHRFVGVQVVGGDHDGSDGVFDPLTVDALLQHEVESVGTVGRPKESGQSMEELAQPVSDGEDVVPLVDVNIGDVYESVAHLAGIFRIPQGEACSDKTAGGGADDHVKRFMDALAGEFLHFLEDAYGDDPAQAAAVEGEDVEGGHA